MYFAAEICQWLLGPFSSVQVCGGLWGLLERPSNSLASGRTTIMASESSNPRSLRDNDRQ